MTIAYIIIILLLLLLLHIRVTKKGILACSVQCITRARDKIKERQFLSTV